MKQDFVIADSRRGVIWGTNNWNDCEGFHLQVHQFAHTMALIYIPVVRFVAATA